MRIKRQRRKLRGKYSGNCLSCAAKWSKCWYIASVDNQAEWESRLSKTVTPAADEVCFQCWDAKIRTSPKRKLHYKAELPMVEDIASLVSADGGYPLRPAKRSKRRSLNEDYSYDLTDSDLYDSKGSSEGSEEEEYYIDEDNATNIYNESAFLDEENAVLLLSTAFHSIPQDIIDGDYHVEAIGAYNRDQQTPSPSPSSPASPPTSLVIIPQHPVSPSTLPVFQSQTVGILSALLAQPVG